MAQSAAHLCAHAQQRVRRGLSDGTAGARHAHTGCAVAAQRHRLLRREQRHGDAIPKYTSSLELQQFNYWLCLSSQHTHTQGSCDCLRVCVCVRLIPTNAHYFGVFAVIPQSCRFRGHKFECGLSISCVLGGGKPLDLCSGGMIWSCCVDKDLDAEESPHAAPINNTSE